MKRQMFMFSNLTCPNCATKLEAAARKLKGVAEATVSFGTGSLTVTYDDAVVTQAEIAAVAEKLDLEVTTVLDRPGR